MNILFLPEIDYFLAIADSSSISQAAQKLFLSPSALSQFLTKLEKKLNVTLFVRGKDSLQLTEAGYIYYYSAKKILHIKDETMEKLHNLNNSSLYSLRLGTTGTRSLSFVSYLWPFLTHQFPECSFSLSNDESFRIYDRLKGSTLDIGIAAINRDLGDEFQFTLLHHEEICMAFAPTHPIVQVLNDAGISPEDPAPISLFANETIVSLPKFYVLYNITMKYMHQEHFTPKLLMPSMQNSAMDVVRILQSVGFTSLGYKSIAKDLVFQRLENPLYYDFGLVYRKDYILTEIERAFIRLALENSDYY